MTRSLSAPASGPGPDSEAEYDLLVQDPPLPPYAPHSPHGSTLGETDAWETFDHGTDDSDPSGDGDGATEYAASPGIPGRGLVWTSLLALGGFAGLDLALTDEISIFFDLCFIVVCLVAAMAVVRHDLFLAGVLPPLVFAAVIGVVAAVAPATFADIGGLSKAFFSGLAEHAGALVTGYAVALVTVGGRVAAYRS